ncbi:MAG: isopentenyl phosphate kinase [Anaerolineae bacterium]
MNTLPERGPGLRFLKLGGSLITRKDRREVPRQEVLARLAREIREARGGMGDGTLLIGHGSGSFGHYPAQAHGIHEGLAGKEDWRGLAETSAAAARLNRLVTDALLEAEVPTLSLQPSASARCHDGRLVSLSTEPIQQTLSHGLVPLLYGDVAFDEVRGTTVVSTEAVFAYLAGVFRPEWIVLASDVSGVLNQDPRQDARARPIERLRPEDVPQLESVLADSGGVDVTGGMLAKVRVMADLVARRPEIRVLFISGIEEGKVAKALVSPGPGLGTLLEAG